MAMTGRKRVGDCYGLNMIVLQNSYRLFNPKIIN